MLGSLSPANVPLLFLNFPHIRKRGLPWLCISPSLQSDIKPDLFLSRSSTYSYLYHSFPWLLILVANPTGLRDNNKHSFGVSERIVSRDTAPGWAKRQILASNTYGASPSAGSRQNGKWKYEVVCTHVQDWGFSSLFHCVITHRHYNPDSSAFL